MKSSTTVSTTPSYPHTVRDETMDDKQVAKLAELLHDLDGSCKVVSVEADKDGNVTLEVKV